MIGDAREMVSGLRVYQEGPRRQQKTPRGGLASRLRFYRGKVHVNQYYFYISTETSVSPSSSSPPTPLSHGRRPAVR